MNIINSVSNANKTSFKGCIIKRIAKTGEIGEALSIGCDFLGKAVIVPAVIMKVSKEPKEKKEYSAFKNPVAAVIQLALEVPVLLVGSKIIEKAADKGFFDKKNSDFSYNQKKFKEDFIKLLEELKLNNNLAQKIKEQGYSKNIASEFCDFIKTVNNKTTKDKLNLAFSKFEAAYKNQFHLKNRICFLFALVLTPLLCAIENYIHPKVMKKVYNYEHTHQKLVHNILKPDMKKFMANIGKKNK